MSSLALLVLVVLGLFVATGTAVWRAAHQDDARRVDHVDLIIVLGAAQYSGRPSATFEGRLDQARHLYEGGFSTRVLVVGGNQPGDITTEGAAGRDWLVGKGLPTDRVFADPVGNDTLESLQGAASFMRARGCAAPSWSPIPGTTCASSGWRPTWASGGSPRQPGTRRLAASGPVCPATGGRPSRT